jgi:hypothetical protein
MLNEASLLTTSAGWAEMQPASKVAEENIQFTR